MEADQESMSITYEFKGRLRGDMNTRSNHYDMGLRNGVYSINDVRRLENQDTIGPEGDERYVNGAMVPLSKLFKGETDQTDPADKEIKNLMKGIKLNGNGIEKVSQHTS
jgi:hypothetical protein